MKHEVGVVYLIHNPLVGITKIGMTTNIVERLKALITMSGCPLVLVYYTPPLKEYSELEGHMHLKHSCDRGLGEWFSTDKEVLMESLKSSSENCEYADEYVAYKEFGTITAAANRVGNSRSYVSSQLKRWGVTKIDYINDSTKAENLRKKTEAKLEREAKKIPFNLSGKFTRVQKNVYTNGYCFKVSIYEGGKMKESYFADVEDAIYSLSNY